VEDIFGEYWQNGTLSETSNTVKCCVFTSEIQAETILLTGTSEPDFQEITALSRNNPSDRH
jgi:hypothetical protein